MGIDTPGEKEWGKGIKVYRLKPKRILLYSISLNRENILKKNMITIGQKHKDNHRVEYLNVYDVKHIHTVTMG